MAEVVQRRLGVDMGLTARPSDSARAEPYGGRGDATRAGVGWPTRRRRGRAACAKRGRLLAWGLGDAHS